MTAGAMRTETIRTADGIDLDARIQGPDSPQVMVVWCHPHPLMGGSMTAPLMDAVADQLSDEGLGVLRFDFRGVGRSTGVHGHGVSELHDVGAAAVRARELAADVVIAGWSFGGAMALRHAVSIESNDRYVAVAPPVSDPEEFALLDGTRTTLVVGLRDQVVDNDAVDKLATMIGAEIVALPTDHLFIGRSRQLAHVIAGVAHSFHAG